MTDHTDIDAAITEAEAQVRHEPGCFECDRWRAQAATLREARALIPEPPSDDERKALIELGEKAYDNWTDSTEADGIGPYVADTIMASPEWRNRGRGPITVSASAFDAYRDAHPDWQNQPPIQIALDFWNAALEAAEAAR
jgi:hypothetical protein